MTFSYAACWRERRERFGRPTLPNREARAAMEPSFLPSFQHFAPAEVPRRIGEGAENWL